MGQRNFNQFYLYDNVKGRFYKIKDGSLCGRTEGDLTFPDDQLMSRRHCRFLITGSLVQVENLSTTNPIHVNAVPMTPGHKRKIQLDDVIEFGGQRFILTNQNVNQPGHTEDIKKGQPIYKAVRNEKGELTSDIEGSEQFTRVSLDMYSFHKLKLREAISNKASPVLHSIGTEISKSTKVKFRTIKSNRSRTSMVLAVLLVVAASSVIYFKLSRKSRDEGVQRQTASVPQATENRDQEH